MWPTLIVLAEEEVTMSSSGGVDEREVCARRTYEVDSECSVDCAFLCWTALYAGHTSLPQVSAVVHSARHAFLHEACSPQPAGQVRTQCSLLCPHAFLCTVCSLSPAGRVHTQYGSSRCTSSIPVCVLLASTLHAAPHQPAFLQE